MIRFQRINLKVLWAVFSSIDNLLSTGDHCLRFQLFLHSETQQRTCLELYGALHHTTGQKSDKATLHFCRHAGFKHVNSMNSLHGILWKSKCLSADWLSLFWSPTSLPLQHSNIHECRHTSASGQQLKLQWMTDCPRRLMCIFLSVYACLYVLAAELRVRPGTKGKEQWPQYTSICPTLFCATVRARACTHRHTLTYAPKCTHTLKEQYISYLKLSCCRDQGVVTGCMVKCVLLS